MGLGESYSMLKEGITEKVYEQMFEEDWCDSNTIVEKRTFLVHLNANAGMTLDHSKRTTCSAVLKLSLSRY